ncbi:hypothetical protein HOY82DRAFT_505042 [Tuber indicum]|nr:hypothetical protein HOY82DRAFT_505042 [Tuber indicum]
MAPTPVQSIGTDTTSSASETPLPPNPQVDTVYYLMEGLSGVEHKEYHGQSSFIQAIEDQMDEVSSGSGGQYMVFCPITHEQFEEIDRIRDRQFKGLRFMYLNHQQALIIKVIAGVHEIAHREFALQIMLEADEMGIEQSFFCTGAATLICPNGRKEGDSTFRPFSRPYKTNPWPTLVLECGLSRSLERLVTDARWWLENSGGDVKIVLVISVCRMARKIHLEKWEAITPPNPHITSVRPNADNVMPIKTHSLDIVNDVVTGAPLHLEFEKLMLRDPVPGEGDIIFDVQQLKKWAVKLWRSTQ